jgi:hypothetical protein
VIVAAGLGLVAALAASASCKVRNDEHCLYTGGNAECDRRYDGALPFCGTVCLDRDGNAPSPNGDGCVDALPPEGCYSPCGEVDVSEDASCLENADTTSATLDPTTPTTSVATDGTTSTDSGPVACTTDDECTDPLQPFCEGNVCVSCQAVSDGDARCAARDSALAVCGAQGSCVECTPDAAEACGSSTPICDANTEQCRRCSAHEECEETACDLETGACFSDQCVFAVPGVVPSLDMAMDNIPSNSDCVIFLAENGTVDYTANLVVFGGRRIALRGRADTPVVLRGDGAPAIAVSDMSTVFVDRLLISGGDAEGITVSGAGSLVFLERTEVLDNSGGGVVVDNGGYVRARNSVVANDQFDVDALTVNDGSAEIIASTLFGGAGDGLAIGCDAGGTAEVRNSIVIARALTPEIVCNGATLSYTATEALYGGVGNVDVGMMSNTWFADAPGADMRLTATGSMVFEDIAQWVEGDPVIDLEGDLRIAIDGAMEHAGADIPL